MRSLAALVRARGVASYDTVRTRIRIGWTLDDALLTPPREYAHPPSEFDNVDLLRDVLAGESSARVLAERYGVAARTVFRIRARLRRVGVNVRTPVAA